MDRVAQGAEDVDIDAVVGHAPPVNVGARWTGVLLLGIALGCRVEPPTLPSTPQPDAGPRPDASVDSGVPNCGDGTLSCTAAQYCDANGRCQTRPTACRLEADCRGGDACEIPVTPTSSVSPGRCVTPSWLCAADSDCAASERCTDLGVCAPKAARFTADGTEPTLIAGCSAAADCGPGGRCQGGECLGCATNAECGALLCDQGRCTEWPTCTGNSSCFPGNVCLGAVCTRSTTGCTSDPSDNSAAGAATITSGHYPGRSICGADQDWYRIVQPRDHGVTIVLRSAKTELTLETTLEDGEGNLVAPTRLALPGFLALRIGVPSLPDGAQSRDLYLEVRSLDQSGSYDLDVAVEAGLCQGDALTLYGDDTPARALLGQPNRTVQRRHCFGDVDLVGVPVQVDDQLQAQAITAVATDLGLRILDESGQDQTATSTRAVRGSGERVGATSARYLTAGTAYVETQSSRGPSVGLSYPLTLGVSLGTRKMACDAPNLLTLSGGSASATGNLASALDLGAPSCSEDPACGDSDACRRSARAEAPDALYRLTPPAAPSVLRARVIPSEPSAQVALAVLSTCLDDQTVPACDRAPLPGRAVAVETLLGSTEPVYLLVSGDGVAGSYTLEVEVEAIGAPANDLCAAAEPLPASESRAVGTYGAADDAELGTNSAVCSEVSTTGLGADRFYALDLAAGERAAVELTGPRGGLLWAGRSCLNLTVTCTAAQALSFDTPVARATFEPAEATPYYVVVDGVDPDQEGTYQLRTIREPELECLNDGDCLAPQRCDDYRCVPVPSNDLCPGTRVDLLSSLVRLNGSTGAANNDYSPSCAVGSAPDVVYRIPVPAGLSELIVRISDARFDPALVVRYEQCASSIDELCNDDVRFPDVLLPEVRIPQPAGGTYYVIVDAYAGEGPFTLEIEAIQ